MKYILCNTLIPSKPGYQSWSGPEEGRWLNNPLKDEQKTVKREERPAQEKPVVPRGDRLIVM